MEEEKNDEDNEIELTFDDLSTFINECGNISASSKNGDTNSEKNSNVFIEFDYYYRQNIKSKNKLKHDLDSSRTEVLQRKLLNILHNEKMKEKETLMSEKLPQIEKSLSTSILTNISKNNNQSIENNKSQQSISSKIAKSLKTLFLSNK